MRQTSSPDWLLIRDLLHGRSEAELKRRAGSQVAQMARHPRLPKRDDRGRIALIGPARCRASQRLGRLLSRSSRLFVPRDGPRDRKNRGLRSEPDIHALYGTNAYRRYERRAAWKT